MDGIPKITLRIEGMQQDVISMLMLRNDEINDLVKKGVENAFKELPSVIVEQAAKHATHEVNKAIAECFQYGEGAVAIKAAVKAALEPIVTALLTKPTP